MTSVTAGPVVLNDDQTNEEGPAIMKLTTITNVSVDGVMQGLGGPDEDRRGGIERGGWALPLFDNEAETFLAEVYHGGACVMRSPVRPADLRDLCRLLGRRQIRAPSRRR